VRGTSRGGTYLVRRHKKTFVQLRMKKLPYEDGQSGMEVAIDQLRRKPLPTPRIKAQLD
jgi:hypothetical protein